MLVVSRKNRESVVIGGADGLHRLFKVTVLGIQGTSVQLGFDVDPGVPVQRAEGCQRRGAEGHSLSVTEDPAARATGGLEMLITGSAGNGPTKLNPFF